MGLLNNLTRIVSAPIEIVDKVILEPIAEVAEVVVEGYTGEE